jgi:hypothetical protein
MIFHTVKRHSTPAAAAGNVWESCEFAVTVNISEIWRPPEPEVAPDLSPLLKFNRIKNQAINFPTTCKLKKTAPVLLFSKQALRAIRVN